MSEPFSRPAEATPPPLGRWPGKWAYLVFGLWSVLFAALGAWLGKYREDPGPDLAACGVVWLAGMLAGAALRRQIAYYQRQQDTLRAQRQAFETLAQQRAEELGRINAELQLEVRQRQFIETALAERQAYLENLFHNIRTGLMVTDPSGCTVVDINQAGAELVGIPREEIIGQPCRKLLVCPFEVQVPRAAAQDMPPGCAPPASEGSPAAPALWACAPCEGRLLSPVRGPVPVLHSVGTIRSGDRVCHLHTLVDTSDRKRVEIAAQREAAKLSSMISGMQEGVVFADAQNVIVEVNDYFCRFVGVPRCSIVGRRLEEFHAGAVLDRLLVHLEAFRTQVGAEAVILQRPLGQAEVILRLQPIYRAGQYDGVLLNVIDVSKLVAARRQAEAATQAKARFLANMSHEIRTPMTAILGYADLLASPGLTPHEHRQYLDIIRRNGQHLLQLINDILDLSKADAGKLRLHEEPTDLRALVDDVAQSLAPRAGQRGNRLEVRFSAQAPDRLLVDPSRLRQVLVNLVGNAVKFTENGVIAIEVVPGAPSDGTGETVRIDVADTGVGIAPEARARLFEAFTQADESTTRQYGGTGLGLAICRHMVELMGGEISVRSTPGQGSVFTVVLPWRSPQAEPAPLHPCSSAHLAGLSASPPENVLQGMRILVAEDNPDNQRLVRLLLARAGAEVHLAGNGRQAVEAALAHPFDLVLMDLHMPEMGGDDATRLLRSNGYAGPIVALSADVLEETRRHCREAGFDAHLPKPIDGAGLLACARSYHRRGSAQSSSSGCQEPPRESQPSGGTVAPGAAPAAAATSRTAAGTLEAAACPDGQSQPALGPITSTLVGDPDIGEILDEFVAGLPQTAGAMAQALSRSDLPELARLAHRLKGAGGSYGYPLLSERAAELEDAAKAEDPSRAAQALARLESVVDAVLRGQPVPA